MIFISLETNNMFFTALPITSFQTSLSNCELTLTFDLQRCLAFVHAEWVGNTDIVGAGILEEHLRDEQEAFVIKAGDLEVSGWLDLHTFTEPLNLGGREALHIRHNSQLSLKWS